MSCIKDINVRNGVKEIKTEHFKSKKVRQELLV